MARTGKGGYRAAKPKQGVPRKRLRAVAQVAGSVVARVVNGGDLNAYIEGRMRDWKADRAEVAVEAPDAGLKRYLSRGR